MPVGPANGRVGAQRRALTTPSTAPASKARWRDAWIWVCKREASAGILTPIPNRFLFGLRAVFFLRISIRKRARGRRVLPARPAFRNSGMRHDQRWRERRRPDSLGSLAGQDTGVVSRHRWFTDCDIDTDRDGGKERRLVDALAARCCAIDAWTERALTEQPGRKGRPKRAMDPGGQPDAIFASPPSWPRDRDRSSR